MILTIKRTPVFMLSIMMSTTIQAADSTLSDLRADKQPRKSGEISRSMIISRGETSDVQIDRDALLRQYNQDRIIGSSGKDYKTLVINAQKYKDAGFPHSATYLADRCRQYLLSKQSIPVDDINSYLNIAVTQYETMLETNKDPKIEAKLYDLFNTFYWGTSDVMIVYPMAYTQIGLKRWPAPPSTPVLNQSSEVESPSFNPEAMPDEGALVQSAYTLSKKKKKRCVIS